MIIYYASRFNHPSDGDIKVLKNGDAFIRIQPKHNGMYVVSNGKPVFEWHELDSEKVINLIEFIARVDQMYTYRDRVFQYNIRLSELMTIEPSLKIIHNITRK